MKTLVGTLLAISIFTGVAFAFESEYKTRFITSATLTIHVKDGQYIVIRNFTQDQAASQRGVLVAGIVPPTPTPTPNPTATATPNPTPTPTSTDLTATKKNNVNGQVTLPNTWTWTIHVANGGNTDANFSPAQTILTDNLPNSNINYNPTSIPVTNPSGITNPSAINCTITGSDLNCDTFDFVTIGAGGSFDVSFTATPAAGTYANPRAGGTCMVDPDNHVTEANENNNTCADTVIANSPNPTPTPIFAPVLTATILHPVAIVNGGPNPPPTGEPVKPIIVAGPATLTIDPVPPATLAITYRKGLQPIQPTPTATVTAATISTSSSFSTSTSAHTSTTTRSTTVTLSDDDEIEWSTPSPTPTPTPSPTPTASPRLRGATTPAPIATPSVTPTATPQK